MRNKFEKLLYTFNYCIKHSTFYYRNYFTSLKYNLHIKLYYIYLYFFIEIHNEYFDLILFVNCSKLILNNKYSYKYFIYYN